MKIINAKVYTEAGIFEEKDVYTDGELIAEKSGDDQVLDAKGCYLIPGLTDIHFHGCVGHDFCDGTHESIEAMAVYESTWRDRLLPWSVKVLRMVILFTNRMQRCSGN